MARLDLIMMLGLALLSASAARAQDAQAPQTQTQTQDVAPGAGRDGVVHINAVKNPEMHAYRAIVAGLDMFDDQHALAPAVPRLLFKVRSRNGKPLDAPLPTAKLTADDFDLALPVDADALFVVPRNQQAWDSKAELRLSRKRKDVRVGPWVRTPGLLENQRRLGDLRLECKVMIAIAKEEIPFWADALIDSLILTRDWCSFFKNEDRKWSVETPARLSSAVLHEGDRSKALEVEGRSFEVPLADPSWGNDAMIDLVFAPADPPAPAAPAPAAPAPGAPVAAAEGDGE